MSFLQVQRTRDQDGRALAYVHLATSHWDQRRGRSLQSRVYLGKLDPSGKRLLLSKGFPARSGQSVALEELRRRHAAGEDLLAWLRAPVVLASVVAAGAGAGAERPARVEVVGDLHLLWQLGRELGLERLLNSAFGEDEGVALLALAAHQTAEGRPLYLAKDWLEERTVPAGLRLDQVGTDHVYALMHRVGENLTGRERFFRGWLEAQGHPEALLYDTTSLSSYAADLEGAEYGYNRDGERLPQVNLALVSARATGLPLWYRLLPGSIPDVANLRVTGELLRDLGLTRCSYSLDRGFYSQANVREMLAHGMDFTLGVPFTVTWARALVRRQRAALASPKRSFPFNGRVLRHVRATRMVELEGGERRPVEAHLFFDLERQAERLSRLEKDVFALAHKAGKEHFRRRGEAYRWLGENARGLAGCFAVRSTPEGEWRVMRKPRAVALMAAHMGYTLVLASRVGLEAEAVLADYRGRDHAEKLFDALKNEDGQHRLRTGDATCAEGRMLLAVVALILRCAMESRLRAAGLLRKLTVAECFAQTRKIKAVHTTSGKRVLLEITKRNRDILAALNVPLPT